MDTLLTRTTPEERLELFNQTAAKMGISARLVEKDFWVCWILQRLFNLPEFGPHLTFKGGTSLSKAFGLIERFSEDIDLIIERSWLGVADAPEGSPKQWIKKIKEACRYKVRGSLLPLLEEEVKTRLGDQPWELTAPEQKDADPRVILFRYPTVMTSPADAYVRSEIKLEINARSDADPVQNATIRPYAAVEFPDVFPNGEFCVQCLSPERTFFEKATLLHEELCRPVEQGVRPRLSRHFYDLAAMLERGISDRIMAVPTLYDKVVEHRAVFFANGWMGDYSAMKSGPLILTLASERRSEWQKDYEQMKEMFFSDPPTFEVMMNTVETFVTKFNKIRKAADA